MARQGHRVWSARLVSLILATSLVLCFCVRIVWIRWTSGEVVDSKRVESTVLQEPSSEQKSHALDPILELARKALIQHRHVRDYTAVLVKRERIGGRLGTESKMEMKLRYHPSLPLESVNETSQAFTARKLSVYLKTIEPPSLAGREVIWIEDANDNKMTAHEAGLLGIMSVDLAPNSRLAMVGNKYPITEIGIEKLLIKLIERGKRDRELGPATVLRRSGVPFGGIECEVIEVIHDSPFAERDGKRIPFEFPLARIYFDESRLLPLKYSSYAWPKNDAGEHELEEEYSYENLRLDVGLTDSDFDTKNPLYRFSR